MMGTRLRETLLATWVWVRHRLDRRQPDVSELGTSAIRRILAISCTAIGDTLMSTAALASLRRTYPDARIVLMVHPAYAALFADNPDTDGQISYDGRWKGFLRALCAARRETFDLVAILHGNEPQATPLAYLCGARWRFKWPNDNRFRYLLSNDQPVKRWDDFAHGIDQRLAVAESAGAVPGAPRRMVLPVSAERRQRVDARLAEVWGITVEQPLLGFQVGASTASRRWRPERYAELGRRLLVAHPDLVLVITGSPQEQGLAEAVAQGIDSPRVIVTAGRLGLADLPALVARMLCLVTPDTGIMHMAVAVRTPVVALFAAAHWSRSGPTVDLDRHIILQKHRTCDPCLGKRCPYAAPLCMDNILTDEVFDACQRQLRAHPEPQA